MTTPTPTPTHGIISLSPRDQYLLHGIRITTITMTTAGATTFDDTPHPAATTSPREPLITFQGISPQTNEFHDLASTHPVTATEYRIMTPTQRAAMIPPNKARTQVQQALTAAALFKPAAAAAATGHTATVTDLAAYRRPRTHRGRR